MFPNLLTGEVRRNYNFSWYVVPYNNIVMGAISAAYVSGLASKIDLPTQEILVQDIKLGTITYPIPSGIKTNPIVVDYLEDDLGSVEQFHHIWQGMAKSGVHSLTLSALSRFGGTGIYMPTTSHFLSDEAIKTISEGVSKLKYNTLSWATSKSAAETSGLEEIPTGLQIYPRIFPRTITPTQVTKDGQSFAGVRIEYIRIPVINNWKACHTNDPPAVGKDAT